MSASKPGSGPDRPLVFAEQVKDLIWFVFCSVLFLTSANFFQIEA